MKKHLAIGTWQLAQLKQVAASSFFGSFSLA
jgi:hypothetical protein